MTNTMTKTTWVLRGLFGLHIAVHHGKKPGWKLKAGTEAQTMLECCSLASFLCFAQPPSLHRPNSRTQGRCHPVCWAFLHQPSIKIILYKHAHGPNWWMRCFNWDSLFSRCVKLITKIIHLRSFIDKPKPFQFVFYVLKIFLFISYILYHIDTRLHSNDCLVNTQQYILLNYCVHTEYSVNKFPYKCLNHCSIVLIFYFITKSQLLWYLVSPIFLPTNNDSSHFPKGYHLLYALENFHALDFGYTIYRIQIHILPFWETYYQILNKQRQYMN